MFGDHSSISHSNTGRKRDYERSRITFLEHSWLNALTRLVTVRRLLKTLFMEYLNGLLFKRILCVIIFLQISRVGYAQTVFISKNDNRYHKFTCGFLAQSKDSILLDSAISKAYSECRVCIPSSNTVPVQRSRPVNNVYTTPPSNRSTSSTQCTGYTKSGRRCQRMTTNSNGRCYQH
jgi:hypothetical protein